MDEGITLFQYDLILTYATTYFQIGWHSEVLYEGCDTVIYKHVFGLTVSGTELLKL